MPSIRIDPGPPDPGGIRGRLIPDGGVVDLSKVVIFAHPVDAAGSRATPRRATTIRRLDESFTPDLSVVSVSQMVHFRDDGDLYHRIFSYSEPNAFDLGVVGGGHLKSVSFEHPGMVRFYCSLHGWESGVIFVTPSPYFDLARPDGEYELVDLPPGRYRIETWSESLSGPSLSVTVSPGRSTLVELPLEPRTRTE